MDGTSEYSRFHSKAVLRYVAGYMVGPLNSSTGEGANDLPESDINNGGGSTNNTVGNNGGNNTSPGNECTNDANCITMDELARHNTANDTWVGLHGNVYDLTDYAGRHPGGSRFVTQLAGIDGTSEYKRFHSSGLLSAVQGTLVGRLEGSPPFDIINNSTTNNNSTKDDSDDNSTNSINNNITNNDDGTIRDPDSDDESED